MEKVFHFDAPREPYESDAAVIWCFDHRFRLTLSKFLKRRSISAPDVITVAGGAKSLASPAADPDGEFVLQQIRTSIFLHKTRRLVLMLHSDCGAYGGLPAFRNDTNAERAHHVEQLRFAAEFVTQAFPSLSVETYFVDFEGVWSVALAPSLETLVAVR
ncbi:MAG: hypothetical protein JO108_26380 [Acidobacteriaceae bacterium]|nr:hypothetical protein [Acidobacteriaceae bacterium]